MDSKHAGPQSFPDHDKNRLLSNPPPPGGRNPEYAVSGESGPRSKASALFVCFRLHRNHYALPLEKVDRALRMVAVTPVPETPDWMAGVIDLHGRIIPVVDLRKKFGFPPKAIDPDDRLLVMESRKRCQALVVDAVTEVIETPTGKITTAAEVAPEIGSGPFLGIIQKEGRPILILDPDRLQASGDATHRIRSLQTS